MKARGYFTQDAFIHSFAMRRIVPIQKYTIHNKKSLTALKVAITLHASTQLHRGGGHLERGLISETEMV
jgi:hypothetical protein